MHPCLQELSIIEYIKVRDPLPIGGVNVKCLGCMGVGMDMIYVKNSPPCFK